MPPTSRPRWEIELTAQAERWYKALSAEDTSRIRAAINRLERKGPTLGRPFADSITGSRHHHMKELRSSGGNLRALFAVDPRRRAIVLVGGDKTGDWRGWYERNIPRADRLYDQHLRDMGKEGPCRPSSREAGRQSGDRDR
ncbi:MAG: diaminopimelate decarboxylase [Solirubrobacterales bacterium]|nr:MAG: diaminopimelate decarboxylase [Solirubrobacterales bacterium]